MGVQDRDYWAERYDALNGRKRRRVRYALPRPFKDALRPSVLITVAMLVLVATALGSMFWRFVVH